MWTKYNLIFELTQPILGTIPKDRNVFENFVMDQAKIEVEKIESRGWTGFYEDEQGHPILLDYQFKGFLKNAGNVLKGNLKVPNLRSHVENSVFLNPRHILLADKPDGVLERPLRAMTMQGPRVSLVRSDMINPGRQYSFEVMILDGSKVTEQVLRDILSYGEFTGLLQWRNGGNGGYGRFKVVEFVKK